MKPEGEEKEAKKPRKQRQEKPEPERFKRGRWVLPVVLAISLLISLYFWYS